MALHTYFAKRWLHMVLLIVLTLAIIGPSFIEGFPELDLPVLGLAPVVAWMLGVNYERSIILEAKLLDPEELREVEYSRSSIWTD
jgi:hypothetical protein